MLFENGKVKETKTEVKFPHFTLSGKTLTAVDCCKSTFFLHIIMRLPQKLHRKKNYTERCTQTHYKQIKMKNFKNRKRSITL